MTGTAIPKRADRRVGPDDTLKAAAALIFVTLAAGMWIFTTYLAVYYGSIVLSHGWTGLYDTYMPKGFIPGDGFGNVLLGTHILSAIVATGIGPLQLVPRIRARAPAFHRWTGRVYITAAIVGAMGGLYLTWARPKGHLVQALNISLNAILVLAFAALALRFAMRRKIGVHRRWALRLLLVVNGPLFLRISYTLWFWFANLTGAKFDRLFDVLTIAQYAVPLAILEFYLRAKERGGPAGRYAVAGGLLAVSVLMGFGVYLATTGMWIPRATSMG